MGLRLVIRKPPPFEAGNLSKQTNHVEGRDIINIYPDSRRRMGQSVGSRKKMPEKDTSKIEISDQGIHLRKTRACSQCSHGMERSDNHLTTGGRLWEIKIKSPQIKNGNCEDFGGLIKKTQKKIG